MVLVKTRSYFSITLIRGAAGYARAAGEQEAAYDGQFRDPLFSDHRANVLGAVIMAAAAMEAFINELFCDAGETNGGHISPIPAVDRALLASMWQKGVPRTSKYGILEKYSLFLTLLRKPDLDRSRNPFQDAHHVVDLRNAFVHFEPSWQTHDHMKDPDSAAAHKFEKALRRKFSENPITGAGNPFYPDKLLGYGCAAWAVGSAVAFIDAFCTPLGIQPSYHNQRAALTTSVSDASSATPGEVF